MFLFFPVLAALLSIAIPEELIHEIKPEKQAYLYKQLLMLIQGNYFIIIYRIILALFLMLNGLIFNKLILSLKIHKANNQFFGFLFLFLIGLSSGKADNLAVMIALLIFILALIIILKTLRKPIAIFDFLNAGMLISISFLFWVNIAFFTPMIFVGLFVLRPQHWREWATALIGLFLPLFIFLSIYFFFFTNVDVVFDISLLFSYQKGFPVFSIFQIIFVSYISLIILGATFKIISRFNTIETDIQDYYKIFFFFFVNSFIVILLNPAILYNVFPFLVSALVIPLGKAFIEIKKKIIAELFFSVFLVFAVLIIINFSF